MINNKTKGRFTMSVEEVKQLATFEYGSRLQGTADAHSDSDMCVLTLPSINNLFFAINKERQNHKVDDTSYVPLTTFVNRIYDKYDIASIILLQCNDIKRTMDEHLTESDEVEDMRNALRTNASQFILKHGKFNE